MCSEENQAQRHSIHQNFERTLLGSSRLTDGAHLSPYLYLRFVELCKNLQTTVGLLTVTFEKYGAISATSVKVASIANLSKIFFLN